MILDVLKLFVKKRGSNTFYILYHLINTNKLKLLKVISFKSGDSKLVESLKKVKILFIISGVQATVATDVVEYDIPLLFSK